MNVQVVTEDYFYGHQGSDLFDLEKANFRNFRIKKSSTLKEFLDIVAENLVRRCSYIKQYIVCI